MAEVQIVFANGKHPGETAGHTSRDRVSFSSSTRHGSYRSGDLADKAISVGGLGKHSDAYPRRHSMLSITCHGRLQTRGRCCN